MIDGVVQFEMLLIIVPEERNLTVYSMCDMKLLLFVFVIVCDCDKPLKKIFVFILLLFI